MPENRAEFHLDRLERMASRRATWEAHWEQVARLVLPRQLGFLGAVAPGERRTGQVYDATAVIGLERFAAALEGLLTPRAQRWHRLRASDERLNEIDEVRRWFEATENILFRARYGPRANYASQQHEVYMSLGAFGSGVLFVDEKPAGGLRYRAVHLGECFFAEDADGRIDTVYRRFEMSARQVMQKTDPRRTARPWSNVPAKVREAAERAPETPVQLVHCVFPRDERRPGRRDGPNMPIASLYIATEGRSVLFVGGFEEMPYAISRYVTAPRETYGRSPAMQALPDIATLNEMSRTMLRAGHKAVDPPVLLHDDGVMDAFDLRPGALNWGGVDSQGRQLAVPFQSGANLPLGLELENQRRQAINDAFLVSLFQVLAERPGMTATEVLQRAQEQGLLLTPTVGRQQSEMLGPLIEREVAILLRGGRLPPLPDALVEADGDYEIEYDSPLSRAQRAEEGAGINRLLEVALPLAQVDPSALDNIDPDAVLRELAGVFGAQKVLRDRQAVEEVRGARQQAAQLQEIVVAAQPVARAARDAAEAGRVASAAAGAAP